MRSYQTKALEEISQHYAKGTRKVLLKLPTGGGKTHIFSEVLKRTSAKGNPCIMVVRGKQLVEQASQRLFREGVSHGVRMANHWNRNYGALVQVCSIDTLISRNDRPPAKIVVIDEAHLFTSPGCKEFLEAYESSFILAVTATPYTKEPLTHVADVVVSPISLSDLINGEFLVAPRYFAPSTPDLKGVRLQQGDYASGQLEERMSILTGDIVSHWKQLGQNRPTIAFAVNLKHSQAIVDQFNREGISAECVEGTSSQQERQAAFERLRKGQTKILSNVGVLCTGVDLPFVSAILMARPTKSYNLYIQQAGRGTRIHPESAKKDFLVLDHAGNVLRHGFMETEREVDLEGSKFERGEPAGQICPECFAIFVGRVCHACEYEVPVTPKNMEVEIEDGILAELKEFPRAAEISIFIRRKKETARLKGYKYGWVYHQVKEKYGEEIADTAFPGQRNRHNPESPWFLRSSSRRSGSGNSNPFG